MRYLAFCTGSIQIKFFDANILKKNGDHKSQQDAIRGYIYLQLTSCKDPKMGNHRDYIPQLSFLAVFL